MEAACEGDGVFSPGCREEVFLLFSKDKGATLLMAVIQIISNLPWLATTGPLLWITQPLLMTDLLIDLMFGGNLNPMFEHDYNTVYKSEDWWLSYRQWLL